MAEPPPAAGPSESTSTTMALPAPPTTDPLTYASFSSAIDVNFWTELANRKLDVLQLSDKPTAGYGFYTTASKQLQPAYCTINDRSLSDAAATAPTLQHHITIRGTIYTAPTLTAFKQYNTQQLAHAERDRTWKLLCSGQEALQRSEELCRFLLLSYCDLKQHLYYYLVCYPTIVCPNLQVQRKRQQLLTDYHRATDGKQSVASMVALIQSHLSHHTTTPYFLVAYHPNEQYTVHSLADYRQLQQSADQQQSKLMLAYVDPLSASASDGQANTFGSPLRHLLLLAAVTLQLSDVTVLAFRDIAVDASQQHDSHQFNSVILSIHLSMFESPSTPLSSLQSLSSDSLKAVGWERNLQNKVAPRVVDLSSLLSPHKLADNAVDVNLRLMRWRLLPDLQLPTIQRSHCLLLGAGTLGCNVARCLLGWGFKHITFVDNGRVSFSNPVRQSLFTFNDCLNGGKPKAAAAADSLKQIYPSINAAGVTLTIPMAGHVVADADRQATHEAIEQLTALIDAHDIIFLLTDSRESRWLPTLLCKAQQKLCINTALGFDTFLVMRHGVRPSAAAAAAVQSEETTHQELGCYFCNDVVAPANSQRDRTLDEQCTVTRPGLAYISSAVAVELAVAALHHPLQQHAPAIGPELDDALAGFGTLPHTIRGFLTRFNLMTVVGTAFEQCTACSSAVLAEYRTRGVDFVFDALNQPASYLEDLTGLTKLKAAADQMLASTIDRDDDDASEDDW